MPDQTQAGRKVAVLPTDGRERSEPEKPVEVLKAASAPAEVVSSKARGTQAREHHKKGAAPFPATVNSAWPARGTMTVSSCRAG